MSKKPTRDPPYYYNKCQACLGLRVLRLPTLYSTMPDDERKYSTAGTNGANSDDACDVFV
jgi:hypothetical protein